MAINIDENNLKHGVLGLVIALVRGNQRCPERASG